MSPRGACQHQVEHGKRLSRHNELACASERGWYLRVVGAALDLNKVGDKAVAALGTRELRASLGGHMFLVDSICITDIDTYERVKGGFRPPSANFLHLSLHWEAAARRRWTQQWKAEHREKRGQPLTGRGRGSCECDADCRVRDPCVMLRSPNSYVTMIPLTTRHRATASAFLPFCGASARVSRHRAGLVRMRTSVCMHACRSGMCRRVVARGGKQHTAARGHCK